MQMKAPLICINDSGGGIEKVASLAVIRNVPSSTQASGVIPRLLFRTLFRWVCTYNL